MKMSCQECGAPTEPGMVRCDYCGHMLELVKAEAGAAAGTAGVAPGGSVPAGMAHQVRALSTDGAWYACFVLEQKSDGIAIRWFDGRQATLQPEMIREPAQAAQLQPGVRVFGEYEGRYYPGTIKNVAGEDQWNIQFDDGETALYPPDRIHVPVRQCPTVNPGQQVLAQDADGLWYPGRVSSGADGKGFQRVRLDRGGDLMVTKEQLNVGLPADLLQVGKKVMGIGEDSCWYPGTVLQVVQGQVSVRFDDGEEAWMFNHQVRFIC